MKQNQLLLYASNKKVQVLKKKSRTEQNGSFTEKQKPMDE